MFATYLGGMLEWPWTPSTESSSIAQPFSTTPIYTTGSSMPGTISYTVVNKMLRCPWLHHSNIHHRIIHTRYNILHTVVNKMLQCPWIPSTDSSSIAQPFSTTPIYTTGSSIPGTISYTQWSIKC
jgi:hypothetical protein